MKLPTLPPNISVLDIKTNMEYYDEYYKLLQLNFPIEDELDDYDEMKQVFLTDSKIINVTQESDEDDESESDEEDEDSDDSDEEDEESPSNITSKYVYNANAKRQKKQDEKKEGPFPVTISHFLYDEQKKKLIGIFYVEYYPISKVAQLNYFCLAPGYKGKKLGKYMLNKAYACTKQLHLKFIKWIKLRQARTTLGRLPYAIGTETEFYFEYKKKEHNLPREVVEHIECYDKEVLELKEEESFFFLAETNKIGVEDGILKSEIRHAILEKLGFSHIPIKYIQPPLSDHQAPCYDLLLLALNSKNPIPSARLLLYMIEFGYSIEEGWTFPSSTWFNIVAKSLLKHEKITLSDEQAPWQE